MASLKILAYIEPRTDLDNPKGRGLWAKFALDFIESLGSHLKPIDGDFYIMGNSWVMDQALSFGATARTCVKFTEEELLAPFGGNHGNHRKATFLEQPADAPQHLAVARAIRRKLSDFNPDIVLTFTAEPALRLAFESALILHHEVGGFSRAPFPQTFRLDPCGLIANSWPSVVRNQLSQLAANEKSSAFINELRQFFTEKLLDPINPFKDQISSIKVKYKKLWLLPLGPPLFNYHYPVPGSPVNFMTQFDLIQWLVPQIPTDQGLLIIEHPLMPFLTAEHIDSISKKFPNACFVQGTEHFDGASQFIVPAVDGVVTVNSSLGYQAALFGKELVTLGNSTFLAPLADGIGPEYIALGQKAKAQNKKDAILHHLLAHYFIPATLFRDSVFISEQLERWIAFYKSEQSSAFDFFKRTAPDEKLLSMYKALSRPGSPKRLFPLSRAMPQSQLDLIRHYDRQYLWPSPKAGSND